MAAGELQGRPPTFGVGLVGEHPPARLASLARLIEDLGYHQLWVADERFYRDVYAQLTLCALNTNRVQLGTCVTDPFIRHPALTAVAIATVDEISEGRCVLGLGAGISGFAALGIQRHKPARAIREAAEVMRALWRGEEAELEGEVIEVMGAELSFSPRADIPIFVTGRGPRILSVAGELGDGVIVGTFASAPGVRYALERIRRGAERAGRRLDQVTKISWLYVSISDDANAAREAVKHGIAVAIWGSRPVLEEIGIRPPQALLDLMEERRYSLGAIQRAAQLIPNEYVSHLAVAGSPPEVADQIRSILELGMDGVAIWPFPPAGEGPETVIEAFGEEVMPEIVGPQGRVRKETEQGREL